MHLLKCFHTFALDSKNQFPSFPFPDPRDPTPFTAPLLKENKSTNSKVCLSVVVVGIIVAVSFFFHSECVMLRYVVLNQYADPIIPMFRLNRHTNCLKTICKWRRQEPRLRLQRKKKSETQKQSPVKKETKLHLKRYWFTLSGAVP